MSVAPLFPEKPVKIVVPTGVSYRKIWEWGKTKVKSSNSPPRVQYLLTDESSCIQLLLLPHHPISIQKEKKKKKHQKGKMLQSAAVWRLMHTADRITKSKYENYCCSPEPPAKSTGPGSGQKSLFRGDVDSNVGWLTVLLGQLHMAMLTHSDMNFEHAMQKRCEQKRKIISQSQNTWLQSLDELNESMHVMQVFFRRKWLSCMLLMPLCWGWAPD